MKYIKHKIQSKLQFALVLLLSALAVSSCINDDNEFVDPNNGTGLVTFSVKVPGQSLPSTYALTEADENEIRNIDVLVFDQYGKYTGLRLSPDILRREGNDILFTVRIPEGERYQINVFANVRDLLNKRFSSSLIKGQSKDEIFSKLYIQNTGRWKFDNDGGDSYRPLPMWGEIPSLTVSSTTPTRNVVHMIRALAKVNVIAENGIEIKEIFIIKRQNTGLFAPAPVNWDAKTLKVTKATPAGTKEVTQLVYVPQGNQSTNEIYLFESDNTSYGIQNKDRNCVIITAYYKNTSYYYRLDFGSYANDRMNYVDILRNHSYTFRIKSINHPGYFNMEDAINGEPINIGSGGSGGTEGNLEIIDNTNIGYAIFDDKYFLGVTGKELTFQGDPNHNNDADLWIATNSPNGYQVTSVEGGGGWLSVNRQHEGRPTTIACGLVMQPNNTGRDRTGYINIEAGGLRLRVKVTQKSA